MMYDSKMALAVKSSGRVLREAKSDNNTQVYMPFGCEYSLMLKNLNSVRALAKIWIDGTDVTEGTSGLVVPPNQSIDIERFIKNGNLSGGNKFKFIERTAAVSNHRGNKIDDGLIRVEFEFEKVQPVYNQYYSKLGSVRSYGGIDSAQFGAASGGAATLASNSIVNASHQTRALSQNETGITVPGAVSDQQFHVASWFPTDGVMHVMVLQMLGEVEGQPVPEPITVQMKARCSSCGTLSKANAKFCGECGTSLQLVGEYAVRG